jgi:hypothetical protein
MSSFIMCSSCSIVGYYQHTKRESGAAIQIMTGEMEQINTDTEQQREPKHRQERIEWRRNMCLELSSQGRTEREIAQILKVGNGTVHRDIAYLNKQAYDNLKNHVNHLSQQYQRCSNGLEQVLRTAWNIVIMESVNQANKLQALSLISGVESSDYKNGSNPYDGRV